MRVKGFTVHRKLDSSDLRTLCIQNDYYTMGDNKEYEHLFSLTRNSEGNNIDMTDYILIEIAEDIFNHSDIDRICGTYGCDEEEAISSILHNVYNACYTILSVDCEE